MSNILITGINGTVGTQLKKDLIAKGHKVWGLGRQHSHDQYAFSIRDYSNIENYFRCDIAEMTQLSRVFDTLRKDGWNGVHIDYVYNCAAEFGRWNGEDYYETLWKTNAIGTKNLIRLQEAGRFDRLIHFSSSEVYGDWQGTMSEDVIDNNNIQQMNDYAMTKRVNEMQIRNSAIQYETESVIVRLFNTYGPGEKYSPYRSVNCRFLYSALKGLPFTVYTGHHRTSTYISDLTAAIANISTNFKPGEIYNIGGTQYHSIEELADIIIKVTGADPNLVSYKESEILTTKSKIVDTTKAQRDLNLQNTIELEEGVRLTSEWMKQYYNI